MEKTRTFLIILGVIAAAYVFTGIVKGDITLDTLSEGTSKP